MKFLKIIIYILSLIIASSLPVNAVKKIEANPINIAIMLTQETDTAKMASTCEYYGYTRKPSEDTYKVFTHNNGSTIYYKPCENNFLEIQVQSKISLKERDQILKNMNFKKTKNLYERKSVGGFIKCFSKPHGCLVITYYSKKKNDRDH